MTHDKEDRMSKNTTLDSASTRALVMEVLSENPHRSGPVITRRVEQIAMARHAVDCVKVPKRLIPACRRAMGINWNSRAQQYEVDQDVYLKACSARDLTPFSQMGGPTVSLPRVTLAPITARSSVDPELRDAIVSEAIALNPSGGNAAIKADAKRLGREQHPGKYLPVSSPNVAECRKAMGLVYDGGIQRWIMDEPKFLSRCAELGVKPPSGYGDRVVVKPDVKAIVEEVTAGAKADDLSLAAVRLLAAMRASGVQRLAIDDTGKVDMVRVCHDTIRLEA